jgi:ABC-type glycerol-3-phosphate transport system substrate-binding protein
VLGVRNFLITAYSKDKPGALELIDDLTTPEAQRLRAAAYGGNPMLSAASTRRG